MDSATIISDPGIDDIIALALLNKLTPNKSHTIISSFGNTSEIMAARNIKEFISLIAPEWKFLHGVSRPLNKKNMQEYSNSFYGPDGVWGIHPNIDIAGVTPIKNFPRAADTLISLSTLTNPYKICKKHTFKKIIIMGGAFFVNGNINQFCEANISFDIEAAEKFFRKSENTEVEVVPLDVTSCVHWTKNDVKRIPQKNLANMWFKKLLITWFEKYDYHHENHFILHDPVAIYLTLFPDAAKWKTSGVRVQLTDKKRGQTVLDRFGYKRKIALELTNATVISHNIWKILFN